MIPAPPNAQPSDCYRIRPQILLIIFSKSCVKTEINNEFSLLTKIVFVAFACVLSSSAVVQRVVPNHVSSILHKDDCVHCSLFLSARQC